MEKEPNPVLRKKMATPARTLNGMRVVAKLHSRNHTVLREFRFYKEFLEKETNQSGLTIRSAEFYHNFPGLGFAGIDCFSESHISVRTFPGIHDIVFDMFLDANVPHHVQLGLDLYHKTVSFFESTVVDEAIEPDSVYIPLIVQKLMV